MSSSHGNSPKHIRCKECPEKRWCWRRWWWRHPSPSKSASRSSAPRSATPTSPTGAPRNTLLPSWAMKPSGLWRAWVRGRRRWRWETVMPMSQPNCRNCGLCRSEKTNLCATVQPRIAGMPRDGSSRITDSSGASLTNMFGISSFSEYTVVDVTTIVKVDPRMPSDLVCPLSCGISTGLGAAWRVADVEAGSSVVIFGLGAVGLAVAEGARLRGAAKIIGVDLNPNKFLIIVNELTKGGADYSFECIGLTSTMNEAFRSSKNGGKTVILGLDLQGSLCIKAEELLYRKTIVGSILGGTKVKVDIPIFIKKYLDKELQLDEFITHEVGFDEINKSFDLLNTGECIRCIIWMDK